MDQQRNVNPNEPAEREGVPAETEHGMHGQHTDSNDESGDKPGSPGPNEPGKNVKSRAGNELFEWIKALAIAGLLVFVIRWFLVSPFIVDGPSMQPNFWDRERIIVNKIIYDIRTPKRGEVIVFHVPEEGRDFIKRVIAVPGDTIKVEGDTIYINGQQIEENYLKEAYAEAAENGRLYNIYESDRSNFPNSSYPDGTVPEGTLFVMGDNRSNSEDSRMIGYIPVDRVVGRADLVFWPIGDFHLVKHK